MELSVADMGQTRDHFAANPWEPGERRLTFHLTLEASPALHEAAVRVHEALADQPAARPVPVPWLHLTMTGFGRSDEVPDEALAQISERVFADWNRFARERIAYDRLFIAEESVMLLARNDPWLQDLAALQRAAVTAVLGERTWGRLWPHTSLSYLTGAIRADLLASRLDGVADGLPDSIQAAPTLTLMELGRHTGSYEWRTIRHAGPAH